MPLDDGGWFDQHHGVEDLRPNPVKPHPEEPVCGEEPKLTRALPPQDGHLMSLSVKNSYVFDWTHQLNQNRQLKLQVF